MAEINWTREAEFWLKDIFDYIASDNPDAAARVVAGICQRVQPLLDFPRMGHRYATAHDREIRILL